MYLPRESMGRRLFCLAFVFFCLFGWKYSFVDFSLLIPGLIVLLFAKSAKFERHVLLVAFGVLILIFYQVVVQMAWLETDAESVLRLFRCFLFCLLVSLLAGSKCFTARELVNALFGALIVHAAIVVVSALFEPANEFFPEYLGMIGSGHSGPRGCWPDLIWLVFLLGWGGNVGLRNLQAKILAPSLDLFGCLRDWSIFYF